MELTNELRVFLSAVHGGLNNFPVQNAYSAVLEIGGARDEFAHVIESMYPEWKGEWFLTQAQRTALTE